MQRAHGVATRDQRVEVGARVLPQGLVPQVPTSGISKEQVEHHHMECPLPSSTHRPHQALLQLKMAVAAAVGDGPQDRDLFHLLRPEIDPTGEEHQGHGHKVEISF